MTLLHLSPVWWLLGLGVLAGVLFLLQRLRVRHREVAVPTTLFWKEAIQEARARLLVKRFRHPLAYALMLLIGALLLTALAGPRTGEDGDVRHVVLVDGSHSMSFDVDELTQYVADLPASNRSVILCGARLLPVLGPGEDALLLPRRLQGVVPAQAPENISRVLRHLARTQTTGSPTHVHLVAVPATVDTIPSGLRVHRYGVADDSDDPRIVTLGIAEPASGAWGVVDLLVRAGPIPLSGGDGYRLHVEPALKIKSTNDAGHELRTWRFVDVPARGQELAFTLLDVRPDGVAARLPGAARRVQLPDRRPLRVTLDDTLAEPFGAVLAADPAVELVSDKPQLVVRAQGSTVGGDVPALELAPAGSQREAMLLHHGPGIDPDSFLRAANKDLGLAQLDGQRLADAAQRPIEVRTEERARRGLTLSGDLMTEPYDFVPSRDFPLFVARTVRWLAEVPALRQRVAAGEPLADAVGAWTEDIEGAGATSSLGAPFTPPVADRYKTADGDTLVAALLASPRASVPVRETAAAPSFSSGSNLATLFLLLAFALLGFEWWAYRTSRVP